jgi:glutamyl/glutaminyl-tRNA synthetase
VRIFPEEKENNCTVNFVNILLSNDTVKMMQELDDNQFWEAMGEQVHVLVADEKKALFIETIKPCIKSAEDALFWARCLCTDELTHGDEGRVVICEAGRDFYQAAIEAIEEHGDDYDYFIGHIQEKTGAKENALFMPVRIALTGVLHGPDLDKIISLIGAEQAKIRFEQVMDFCHCH